MVRRNVETSDTYILTIEVNAGDVVYLGGLGNSVVILNSLEAMNDLLDKRSTNYSHRPVFTMCGEMMTCDRVCLIHYSLSLLTDILTWVRFRCLP
jgi:hypothetical protein